MNSTEFWNVYYERMSNPSFVSLKRNEQGYLGVYNQPLAPPDDSGKVWDYEKRSFSISKDEILKYSYSDDYFFKIDYNLRKILLEIVNDDDENNLKMLYLIFKEELKYHDSLIKMKDFISNNDISIDIFIKRINTNIRNKKIFTDEYFDFETFFIFNIFSKLREPKTTEISMFLLESSYDYIVKKNKQYIFVSSLINSLLQTNDKKCAKRLIDFIENSTYLERITFGKVLKKIYSFDQMLTIDDIGGGYESDVTINKWKEIYSKYKDLSDFGFLMLDANSIFWEHRFLVVKRAPNTKEGLGLIIALLNDEVKPVRDKAKEKIEKYIDLTKYYENNKINDENNEKLKLYLQNNFRQILYNAKTEKYEVNN